MVEDKEEEEIIEDEKEKKEAEGKETPTADPSKRSKPASTPVIDAANAASERMEKANQERKELITREEALEANKISSVDELTSQISSLFSLEQQNIDADNDETIQLRRMYR